MKELPEEDQRILAEYAKRRHGRDHGELYATMKPDWEWEGRARLAADWLGKPAALVDVGCGVMTLKRLLPETRYIGVDVASRDDNTVVVDLNAQALPQFDAPAAAALGVMEYLLDPAAFMRGLRQFEQVVMTYNHLTLVKGRKKRLSQFWVNHLTRRELADLFKASGFRVVRERRLSFGERMYDLA